MKIYGICKNFWIEFFREIFLSRKFGTNGIDGMSWEENQGSVEVRKYITASTAMKKTVQNWKVVFEPGKKE